MLGHEREKRRGEERRGGELGPLVGGGVVVRRYRGR